MSPGRRGDLRSGPVVGSGDRTTTGGVMTARLLRQLTARSNRRLILLLALLAAAWIGWAYAPPQPLVHWERPSAPVAWPVTCPDATCFGAAEIHPTELDERPTTLRLWQLATGRDLGAVPLRHDIGFDPQFA